MQELWDAYLRLEESGPRKQAMQTLVRFAEQVKIEEGQVWQKWAVDLARRLSDTGLKLQIRLPLYELILLPALAPRVLEGIPGCARWLAFCGNNQNSKSEAVLPPPHLRGQWLLREALRVEPQDQISRLRLIKMQLVWIDYSLHEVPWGVLGDKGGQTPEEYPDAIEYLDEFEANLRRAGLFTANEGYCKKCRWYYTEYRDYILQRRGGGFLESFEEYLIQVSNDENTWPPAVGSRRLPAFQHEPVGLS